MDTVRIWKDIIKYLEETAAVNEISLNTWFKPLKIRRIDEDLNIIYLELNNDNKTELHLSLLKNRYMIVLENAFSSVLKEPYRIVLKTTEEYDYDEGIKQEDKIEINLAEEKHKNLFNPQYSFENFVVGQSNRYAYSASLAVAESPSEAYNPFYIYGDSGLGKTHLMHAIGLHLLEKHPELDVLYVSSEDFTNELIKALQEHKMNEFKTKYRKVDVLLIDDIQFIEGKDSTQEEFFHTFNALYGAQKQIIISSDKAPNKLDKLEKRLRSRFQWNLIADIQPPDYETRVAVLVKKAENMGISVDEIKDTELYEVLCMIANKITDNVRELEGALTRIVSYCKLLNEEPNKLTAGKILKDIINTNESKVTPDKIKKIVCEFCDIKLSDMDTSKRSSNIAYPRQIAMYLVRELTDLSLSKIGECFGNKHYTTILHACDKIENDLKKNNNLKEMLEDIKGLIMSDV